MDYSLLTCVTHQHCRHHLKGRCNFLILTLFLPIVLGIDVHNLGTLINMFITVYMTLQCWCCCSNKHLNQCCSRTTITNGWESKKQSKVQFFFKFFYGYSGNLLAPICAEDDFNRWPFFFFFTILYLWLHARNIFSVLSFFSSSLHAATSQGIALVSRNESPGATLITTRGQYGMALTRTHTHTHTHTHTRIILLIKAATIAWPPHREAHTPRARVQIISRRTGPPSPPPTVLSSPSLPLPLLLSIPSCLSVLLEVQGSFVDFSGAAIWPQRGAEASKILLWWL